MAKKKPAGRPLSPLKKTDSVIANACIAQMEAKGISIPMLAKKTKIATATLYGFLRRGASPRLAHLEKVMKALDVQVL